MLVRLRKAGTNAVELCRGATRQGISRSPASSCKRRWTNGADGPRRFRRIFGSPRRFFIKSWDTGADALKPRILGHGARFRRNEPKFLVALRFNFMCSLDYVNGCAQPGFLFASSVSVRLQIPGGFSGIRGPRPSIDVGGVTGARRGNRAGHVRQSRVGAMRGFDIFPKHIVTINSVEHVAASL